MAVYTKLSDEEILEILAHFSIASVRYTEGIIKGSENSNYYVETSHGKYILTIFESRTNEENIPLILDMLNALSEANIICPDIVTATSGQRRYTLPNGKICILQTFMDGEDVLNPTPMQCYAAGKTLANIHNVSQALTTPDIENMADRISLTAMFADIQKNAQSKEYPSTLMLIKNELQYQSQQNYSEIPLGFIHGDYFKDNVLFTEAFVSGVIDFWFSCVDCYAYDLAIALNAWGFDEGTFSEQQFETFLQGYAARRVLNAKERQYLPNLLRLASLRFLITRLYDKLNGKCSQVMANKPFQTWEKRLQYHQDKIGSFKQ